ncbi:3-hydroxyacyl-CoA dehydrogenase family protein [Lacisediminihabitans profunda]|uniref:3-hydroxyacyl-CoA dehydrogenase family protein n=1 Tax=Lacisediminihabitans profunda TaxID=2594790 RepID=A0A5C8UNM6_9MICO|nr:3-hydroxyacyl-CoA dehydrogenase family protein [Lacisediminihabitans profunda]TXN29976.1 3-hydroxyacyl-CoA dehydrogenase family protein [Lacisediminihabitans profunda]
MVSTVQTVAVIGSGYMGGGIAQVLALAGCQVVLGDLDAETAARSYDRLTEQAAAFEAAGLFPADATDTIRAGLRPAASLEDAVADVDYVTEAVPEVRAIKADVLRRISAAARADTIIGSNTSAIPISELARSVTLPARFLGVHWMNPAPFIPGVELIAPEHTDPEVVDRIEHLLRRAGKVPARVSDSPGFVANRLQFALFKEAALMVEEGLATAEQVDLVVSNAFGFRLALFGPFAIADMAGLDVYNSSYESLQAEYGDRLAAPRSLAELVESGHLGIKSGGGYLAIDPAQQQELLAHRDSAYARLSRLRAELGTAPGLSVS